MGRKEGGRGGGVGGGVTPKSLPSQPNSSQQAADIGTHSMCAV